MKKIKITITMTEQEAEWLEQACFIEEEAPHSKFLNRVSRLARRARHAFQQSVQADGVDSGEIDVNPYQSYKRCKNGVGKSRCR